MYILVYYQFNTRGAQYHHLLSLAYNYMSVLPLITHAAALNTVQAGPSTGLDRDQNKPACMRVDPPWSEVWLAASPYCMPWWSFSWLSLRRGSVGMPHARELWISFRAILIHSCSWLPAVPGFKKEMQSYKMSEFSVSFFFFFFFCQWRIKS